MGISCYYKQIVIYFRTVLHKRHILDIKNAKWNSAYIFKEDHDEKILDS